MAAHRFRLRLEELADDALLVVRGGLLEATTLRADAVAAQVRFGEFAISVFGAANEAELEGLAAGRLSRFEILTATFAGAIRRAELSLLPTFRRPHFSILLPDLDADLRRLLQCQNKVRVNAHYEPPEKAT